MRWVPGVVNGAASYGVWWACVGGAAAGWPWAGPAAAAAFAFGCAWTAAGGRQRVARLVLAALAGVLGYLADSVLVLAGVLSFPAHAALGWPSALWMVALWVNLALTMDSSMAWLRGRYVAAALFGALGGPLAYAAGARVGAAAIGPSASTGLAAVVVVWAAAMPFLVWLAERTVFAAAPGGAAAHPSGGPAVSAGAADP